MRRTPLTAHERSEARATGNMEIQLANAISFRQKGEAGLDKLVRGEAEAKFGLLVAQAAGLNIVLGGDPGGGKSTLLDHSHLLIEGIDDDLHVARIPALSDLTPQRLVGGESVTELVTEDEA